MIFVKKITFGSIFIMNILWQVCQIQEEHGCKESMVLVTEIKERTKKSHTNWECENIRMNNYFVLEK